MSRPLRLAGLISGGGRTLLNVADHVESGALDATIDLVVASRPCPGAERARARGFDVLVAPPDEHARHDAVAAWLAERDPDLVCLCGYLRWLRVDAPFQGRVINIHPALLPDFGGPGMYGLRVHKAVLAAKRQESGCTVHFVDEQYDHGPTILRRRCPVMPDDDPETLAARVFEQECKAYPEAIRLFGAGRLRLAGGRVEILDEGKLRAET